MLLLTEEEDAADTIKPRFLAAGGDPAKLLTMRTGAELFRIERDAERLKKMIQAHAPDTRLIVIDPVLDYTAKDANTDGEVRPMLNELVQLASELRVAILGINHLNKKNDLAAQQRVAGARGWVSVARLNFLVGKHPILGTRHLVPLKMNVARDDGGSLDYAISPVTVNDGGMLLTAIPRIVWCGRGNVTAEELTAARPKKAEATKRDAAEEMLRQALADGQWRASTALKKKAAQEQISERELDRVAVRLGVEKRKVGMPATGEWRLPVATPTRESVGTSPLESCGEEKSTVSTS